MGDASPLPEMPAPPALTQPADGAVVGLVAQGVGAGIAEAEVAAGQDEGVADVREADDALGAVITHLILGHLPHGRDGNRLASRSPAHVA